jgi:CheY-like chemotaxis protein
MTDDVNDLFFFRGPVAGRPLTGTTILLVEDSRFACDAMRLLSLRSGARIRRADSLKSAHRHLQSYRPGVAIVDLGLPDGSGIDLIRDLAAAPVRVPAILALSGDTARADEARAAGADGFLAKPLESLAEFQRAVLTALSGRGTADLRLIAETGTVVPDPLALQDDLTHAARVLDHPGDPTAIDYVARFVTGIGRLSRDRDLETAGTDLSRAMSAGPAPDAAIRALSLLIRRRLRARAAI